MRMNAAEKKAAALPPKLTVPMILFFLVLFAIILGPAGIQVSQRGISVTSISPAASNIAAPGSRLNFVRKPRFWCRAAFVFSL